MQCLRGYQQTTSAEPQAWGIPVRRSWLRTILLPRRPSHATQVPAVCCLSSTQVGKIDVISATTHSTHRAGRIRVQVRPRHGPMMGTRTVLSDRSHPSWPVLYSSPVSPFAMEGTSRRRRVHQIKCKVAPSSADDPSKPRTRECNKSGLDRIFSYGRRWITNPSNLMAQRRRSFLAYPCRLASSSFHNGLP